MPDTDLIVSDSSAALKAGQAALARGAWEEARGQFEAALALDESPEALEGLGMAAWWLDDAAATFDARERAYRLFQARGDACAAARVAIWIAWDAVSFRGELAVSNGWLLRAQRLLEPIEPGPEHVWLALRLGANAVLRGNEPRQARRLAIDAAALAERLGLGDLRVVALALEGLARVSEGEVAEGMRLLDEATAAAVAGDVADLNAVGFACCYQIFACERVRDFDRAAQWCERLQEFCRRWRIRSLLAVCRTHYASVQIWRGEWEGAEETLSAAQGELDASRPGHTVEAVVRLAELRRRQGRLEEAADLFARCEPHPLAQIGRAALALEQGDSAQAVDLAERLLRRLSPDERTERAAALEVLVRARCGLGASTEASAALAELRSTANLIGTDPLLAAASAATGALAAAGDDLETARRAYEDAVDLFERGGSPFESARARLELARVLQRLDRLSAARSEARLAETTLQRLGALLDAERAAELGQVAVPAGSGAPDSARSTESAARIDLTPREVDVLQLVAQGLSNRDIASQLVLSQHTVHRHLANILTKLDLPSRAAAAAYAARQGLL